MILSRAAIFLSDFDSFSFEGGQYIIFYKGSAYSGEELSQWIALLIKQLSGDNQRFEEFLTSELNKIYGLFSFVFTDGYDCYVVGDLIRSIPVFYGFINNLLFITDDLYEYQKQNGFLSIDNDKLEEFTASGFVYGNRTIYKNVFALQAGEIVSIKEHRISSVRYFKFEPRESPGFYKNLYEFTEAFNHVLESVFLRMLRQTPNVNRWIVPLSGGHDSRIIVNYLYKLGLRNVVCFSYGLPGNEQSSYSRKVAETLGFEWHFVEYTEQKWQHLQEIGIIDRFINYSFNGVSTPHLQDFLAVWELKGNGVLKQNDVFVPGHTFDFLVGSNLDESDINCHNKIMALERTLLMHSNNTKSSSSPVKAIENIYDDANIDPRYFQEYFNWQEKRAKFLVNSVKGYEFFGFEVRFPFWDKEVVDLWLMVPSKDRMGRKIFFEAERQGILVDQLISIPFFGKSDRVSKNITEDMLRRLVPGFAKTVILRITRRKVAYNAGINQVFALKASTLKELLAPVEDIPSQIRPYFKRFLDRYLFQLDPYFLTTLYTIRKELDIKKGHL